MVPEKIIKNSIDGWDYAVLKTPCEVTFQEAIYEGSTGFGDDYRFYHVYMKCEELRNSAMPVDANPREPSRGDVVNNMVETIRKNPEKFHHRNNGITVICDNFSSCEETGVISVSFKEGDGICNGGHTYFSIVTFPNSIADHCFVHLEFIKIPNIDGIDRKQIVNDIASARNRNRQLLPTTQADFLGYYKRFKDCLGESSELVSWHEGDSNAHRDHIKSDHYIRMMACLDPFWFSHPLTQNGNGANHKKAAGGTSANHRKWFDGMEAGDYERNLLHMATLGLDILSFRDYISFSLANDNFGKGFRKTNFYSEWIAKQERQLHHGIHAGQMGLDIPPTVEIMILGSLRWNVWVSFDEEDNLYLIGWYEDPQKLWDQAKQIYINKLVSLFNSFDQNPQEFARKDSPFDLQLTEICYGMKLPEYPEIIYDLNTNNKYIRSKVSKADYILEISSDAIYSQFVKKCDCEDLDDKAGYQRVK